MSFDAPHIMLLDEPTNHLDIDAREALIQALNNYSGAVILVSHDPHLVECVADQLWLVADGNCKPYDGDLDAYRKLVIRQRRLEREQVKKDARNPDKKQDNAPDPQAEADRLESHIADLSERKQTLESEIATCFSENNDPQRLKRLNAAYADLEKELDHTEQALAKAIARL
jgi:ATP-binding cassette subfamily F protein 3